MSWVGWFCVIACPLLWWWWLSVQRKRKEEETTNFNGGWIPKGSMGWPLIGETIEFMACGCTSRPLDFLQRRRALYGKVFKSHLFGRPIIISTDYEVNKVILQNDGRTFIPCYPKSITEILGKSSILKMNGNLHKRVHGLIASFMKSPAFKDRITKLIEKLVKLSFDEWKDRQHVYIQDVTKEMAFQILVGALLSIGPGEEMQFLKREFEEVVRGLICLPVKLPGSRLHKSLKAKDRMLKRIKKVIVQKIENREQGAVMDVADVLLKAVNDETEEQRLTIDFICGNIMEMMIPGEETVPTLMTLAIKYLSDSPSALNQLREENTELKRKKENLGQVYDWTDYMSLPFTHNVINESLRMGNIINAVWRKALKDVKIKEYVIPKGWCVLTSFTSIHLDEENYDNPCEFNPPRWQKKEGSIPTNFTPFGGGQRLCPGLELSRLEVAIFLHHFVTSFSWVAEEDIIVTFPTVKMKKKMPVFLHPVGSI